MTARPDQDPGAFRIPRAHLQLKPSPRQPPTAKLHNQACSYSKELRSSFESAVSGKSAHSGNIQDVAASQVHILRERRSISRSLQRQRPSVADLRESFERVSRPKESGGAHNTPVKPRTSLPTPIRSTARRSLDHPRSSPRRAVGVLYHPQSRQLEIDANPVKPAGSVFHKTPTFHEQKSSSRSDSASSNHTPTSSPASKSCLSRLGIPVKSSAPEMSPHQGESCDPFSRSNDTNITETSKDARDDFAYSSPTRPLLLSIPEPTTAMKKGGGLGTSNKSTVPSKTAVLTPDDQCKDLGSQADVFCLSEDHTASGAGAQESHRPNRVADLRRLFDRSSPKSLVSFRRQRQTLSSQEPRRLGLGRDEAPIWPDLVPASPGPQQPSTPPALTTKISINDFSCNFIDGNTTRLKASSPTELEAHSDSLAGTLPHTSYDSPLRQRIDQYEHIHSQSRPQNPRINICLPQTDEDPLTAPSSLNMSTTPVPVLPSTDGSRHPIRSVWRRISSSWTQSIDDGNSYSHSQSRYHSSFQESTLDSSRTPPPHNALLPLRPARKSFPFLRRLSSRASSHMFGLDGANHSILDSEASAPMDTAATSLAHDGSHASTHNQSTSLPGHEDLRECAPMHTKGDRKAQKKADRRVERQEKQERRERRRWQRAEKERERGKAWLVSRMSSGASSVAAPTRTEAQVAAQGGGTGTKGDAEADRTEGERTWGKQTASGFMVREARLGSQELAHPRPDRPGQVRKIVNLYKEKSSSMLRIASGHLRVGGGHVGGNDSKNEGKVKQKDKVWSSAG